MLLILTNGTEEVSILRVFDGESQTLRFSIDGKDLKGASAKSRLFETFWPDAVTAKDGDDSLSSALTRSVYLQQDRLRNFLEGTNDQERFNVISELVGAGRLTDLQIQLEKESRSWSSQTTKLAKEQKPMGERVEALETLPVSYTHLTLPTNREV